MEIFNTCQRSAQSSACCHVTSCQIEADFLSSFYSVNSWIFIIVQHIELRVEFISRRQFSPVRTNNFGGRCIWRTCCLFQDAGTRQNRRRRCD